MPNVWMDDVPRVQTVGAGGIGVSPAIPVEEKAKVEGSVRGVAKTTPVNTIPNPGAVNTGDAIVEDSGVWGSGEAGGGSGGGGMFLINVSSGEAEGSLVLDKTWQEIWDAADDGEYIATIFRMSFETGIQYVYARFEEVGEDDDFYYVDISPGSSTARFITDSVTGYPVYANNGGI